MMTVTTPAGLPPLFLPFGEVLEEPVGFIEGASGEFNLLEGSSGLLDSSTALASKLGRGRRTPVSPKGRIVSGPSKGLPARASKGTPIPDEDVILAWAREVRDIYRSEMGDFLSVEGLCYWVRYSFPPYLDEYKAIAAIIVGGISDGRRD